MTVSDHHSNKCCLPSRLQEYTEDFMIVSDQHSNECHCDTCTGYAASLWDCVKSLGLKVKFPMKASIDNSGTVFLAAVFLAIGWSIGVCGQTHHVEVQTKFQ